MRDCFKGSKKTSLVMSLSQKYNEHPNPQGFGCFLLCFRSYLYILNTVFYSFHTDVSQL
jgi:hypothetical protein